MARQSKKQRGKETIVTESVRTLEVPQPTTDVVTEKRVITTEPEIEIRKPGTLAQALTEPAVAVGEEQNAGQTYSTKAPRGLITPRPASRRIVFSCITAWTDVRS